MIIIIIIIIIIYLTESASYTELGPPERISPHIFDPLEPQVRVFASNYLII